MKKGITIVFIANIINMVFSIITSFILPKYLSIESYGYLKTFQLYVNYLGIAHLGFVDGIYLRYGGKDIKCINSNEVLNNSATIRNMQLIITGVVLVISIKIGDMIAILLALSCVPVNMVSFYKNLYQATGEFKNYGTILTLLPMMIFVCNIILLFGFRSDNYITYVLVIFISNLVLYILLEYKNCKMFGKVKLFALDYKLLKENIISGITLTIGNFASILLTSIDRWCIQVWMPISDFSYYSFAVSVENLFNVCVSAVTTTLYNYLCKVKENRKIIKLKTYCVFTGIYLVAVAFPVKFIIDLWLTKYDSSINCMFILICAHSFYFVVKAIYVNLYKAQGQQKHYLYQMLVILVIAALLNVLAFFVVSKTKESFAYATLLTAIIWYFICYAEFKKIRGKMQESILMIVCSAVYLVCGLGVNNSIIGFVLYILIITALSLILCRKEFVDFLHMCIGYADSIMKKSFFN